MDAQEAIAFALVGLAAVYWVYRVYRSSVAEPLARWLLKCGQVKLAMRVRGQARTPGCEDCD